MPLLSTRGAASARGFGFFGGTTPLTTATYWYATSSSGVSGSGKVSQSGLLSMLGSNSTSGGTRAVRFNTNGTITYNAPLTSGSPTPAFRCSTSSSSYDMYAGEYYYNGDATRSAAAFYTLDKSTGAVVAKSVHYQTLGSGAYFGFTSAAAVSDSSCYAAGRIGSAGTLYAQISRFDPATGGFYGAVSLSGFASDIFSIAGDSSYAYAVGADTNGWTIIKISSSLSTISWSKKLTFSGSATYDAKIAVDSSGNVYVAGATTNGIDLIKLNSSGNLLLQKSIAITDVYEVGLAVSSVGLDAYLYVSYSVYANKTGIVAKLARSDFSLDSAISIATNTSNYIGCSSVSNSVDYSILDVFIQNSSTYGYTDTVGALKISSLFSGMYGTYVNQKNTSQSITLASVTPTINSASNTFSTLSATSSSVGLGTLTAPSLSSTGATTTGSFYVIQS